MPQISIASETKTNPDYDLPPPTLSYKLPTRPKTPNYFLNVPKYGRIHYEFDGIYKFAIDEIKNQFKKYYRQRLQNYYFHSFEMDYKDYLNEWNELNQIPDALAWWNRSWLDSLPISKGGRPNRTIIHIGADGDLFKLGPLTITRNFKGRIRDYGIYVDGSQEDLKTELLPDQEPLIPLKSLNVNVNQQKEKEWRWLKNRYWHLRFRPSINIKLMSSSPLDMIENVSLKSEMKLFMNRTYFADFDLMARYQFSNEEFEILFSFKTILW